MITAKKLKELLSKVPDEATIYAYEGEDVGLGIRMPDGSFEWIRAIDNDKEDNQDEFSL